jgi:hypothetical protein
VKERKALAETKNASLKKKENLKSKMEDLTLKHPHTPVLAPANKDKLQLHTSRKLSSLFLTPNSMTKAGMIVFKF